MKPYYFTFGQGHITTDGTRMQHYWVRVMASDAEIARDLFISRFSSRRMLASDKWSWQYEQERFKPEFYPKGEYEVIWQNEEEAIHFYICGQCGAPVDKRDLGQVFEHEHAGLPKPQFTSSRRIGDPTEYLNGKDPLHLN